MSLISNLYLTPLHILFFSWQQFPFAHKEKLWLNSYCIKSWFYILNQYFILIVNMNKLSKLFSSSVKKVLACGSEMNISMVNRFWVYLVLFKIMKETAYILKIFLVDPIPKKSHWNISGYIVGETDVGRQINFIFHFSALLAVTPLFVWRSWNILAASMYWHALVLSDAFHFEWWWRILYSSRRILCYVTVVYFI